MMSRRAEIYHFGIINVVLPELLSVLIRVFSVNAYAPWLVWIAFAAILGANLWRFRVSVRWRGAYAAAAVIGISGFVLLGILSPLRTVLSLPWVISTLAGG